MYSKYVKLDEILSRYDTILDFCINNDIFYVVYFWWYIVWHLSKKTASLSHDSDKKPSAKWPHKPGENIMFLVEAQLYNWICH